jgi:hypothetical protein
MQTIFLHIHMRPFDLPQSLVGCRFAGSGAGPMANPLRKFLMVLARASGSSR